MNRTLRSVLLSSGFATLCLFTTAHAQRDIPKLNQYLNLLDSSKKAMISIAISRPGEEGFYRAIGFAGPQGPAPRPADTATEYRIGSITKTFTAVLTLRAAEQNKLSLTDTLAKWFPSIPNAGKITVRDMLFHKSGLFNFTSSPDYPSWCYTLHTQDQMVEKIAKYPPSFAPGKEQKYSNANYVLLGFILEKVYGEAYSTILEKEITKPLGLSHTRIGGPASVANNQAMPHTFVNSRWSPAQQTDMSVPGGAGAIISTPAELTVFIDALMRRKILLSPASLATMTTPEGNFGMGIVRIPFYDKVGLGHTGGIDDFASMLVWFESDSTSFAMITNGCNTNFNSIAVGALSCWYGTPWDLPTFVSIPTSVMRRYEGVYTSEKLPLAITITVAGSTLTAQATGQGPLPLEPAGETEYTYEAAAIKITFEKDANGLWTKMKFSQGGASFDFKR